MLGFIYLFLAVQPMLYLFGGINPENCSLPKKSLCDFLVKNLVWKLLKLYILQCPNIFSLELCNYVNGRPYAINNV